MSREYEGNELEVFGSAENWKTYVASRLALRGVRRVLEVGAGLGGTTQYLCDGTQESWLCLEPDESLAAKIRSSIAAGRLPGICSAKVGTLKELAEDELFDAVLYIDVLEHIEQDAAELTRASRQLRPGGRLIVLSPAHQWLFSPFDTAIGHLRRYTRASLASVAPNRLSCESLDYLDSVGMMLSLGNRLLLRSATPSLGQVQFWDKRVVPMSRLLDRALGYRVGKSVLGIWRLGGSHVR